MSAILNFDANSVAPDAGSQDALPAGWYDVAMEASEMKPTRDQTGSYLECKFKVTSGACAGRTIYARLNLRNANPTAQEIGYKQLSAICHAVGVLQVQDSAQLHNRPLKIKVKLRAARQEKDAAGNVTAEYEASNEITAFKNINENVGSGAAAVTGGFPGQAAAPAFAVPPTPPSFAVPASAFQTPQAPQQQFAAPAAPQPWAQQPAPQAQAPQQFAPPQQFAQQQMPPAAAQQMPPVQQAPQQQFAPPVQQAPQQPAQQQAPQQFAAAQGATPPWMQQPAT